MKSFRLLSAMVLCNLLLIQFAHAANYYWVGGSGNWSDFANHWATTSGGSVFRTQVPTSLDDVYFDSNSFTAPGQTVNADTTIVYCRDMNWTGATNNPAFASANSSIELKVFGSLTLNTVMNFTFNGKLTFTALASGKTIATFGKTLPCPIEFNGAGGGGGWTMLDSLTCTQRITLTYGTLRTNDNNIKCGSFRSYNTNARALYLGTSTVKITDGGGNDWDVSRSLTIDADSSIIRLVNNAYFYSEGHVYNIIQWDSAGYGSSNSLRHDSLKVNKAISYNSGYLIVSCRACQIDTIVALGSFETDNGGGNRFKYVDVNHNSSIYAYGGYFGGDSIYTMLTGGNIVFGSFGLANNYIGNLTVHGNLTINSGPQTFDTCEVHGNGSFLSDGNDLGILTITQGKTFTFGANKTQVIDSLIPLSTPAFPIQLVSSDLGLPANVVINSPLCADYLYIHGLHATGNSSLYAGANSNDVTNNTGWIFASCFPNSCSAFFDIYPDTIQHHYFAINMASGISPLTYSWDWGDGSVDTIAFPSHTYSAAGFYTICLTITDSLGCTDTYCNSYTLQKTSRAIIQVNVIAQIATAITENAQTRPISIFPNPAMDYIEVFLKELGTGKIELFDLAGKIKHSSTIQQPNTVIDIADLPAGIYVVSLSTSEMMWRQKITKL